MEDKKNPSNYHGISLLTTINLNRELDNRQKRSCHLLTFNAELWVFISDANQVKGLYIGNTLNIRGLFISVQ